MFVISALSLTFSDAEGHGDNSIGAGDSIQTADEVRQVVQHTQVVLHHNDVPKTQVMTNITIVATNSDYVETGVLSGGI